MPIHIPHKCQKLSLRSDGTPWFSEFPEPVSTPTKIQSSEVYSLLEDRDAPDQERPHTFLLIDTRRTDCVGGTIKGSINLPAHSFYWSRKMLFDLCRQAGVGRVVFYCGMYSLMHVVTEFCC